MQKKRLLCASLPAIKLVCLEAVPAGIPCAGLASVGHLVEEVENPPNFRPPQRKTGKVDYLFLEFWTQRLGQLWLSVKRAKSAAFDRFDAHHRIKTLGDLVLEVS